MTTEILAAAWTPGPLEIVVILFVSGLLLVPVALIVLFAVLLIRSNKEKQKLRLELGKLAEEVQLLRRELKGDGGGDG